jgi:hypothetical protein
MTAKSTIQRLQEDASALSQQLHANNTITMAEVDEKLNKENKLRTIQKYIKAMPDNIKCKVLRDMQVADQKNRNYLNNANRSYNELMALKKTVVENGLNQRKAEFVDAYMERVRIFVLNTYKQPALESLDASYAVELFKAENEVDGMLKLRHEKALVEAAYQANPEDQTLLKLKERMAVEYFELMGQVNTDDIDDKYSKRLAEINETSDARINNIINLYDRLRAVKASIDLHKVNVAQHSIMLEQRREEIYAEAEAYALLADNQDLILNSLKHRYNIL